MARLPLAPLIDQQYAIVYAYAGVDAIRLRLAKEEAIVVLDEEERFIGLITPRDVVQRGHRLVIDCLQEKPTIHPEHSVSEALHVMIEAREYVLPVVYERGKLAGLLRQRDLIKHLLIEKN